MSFFENLAFVMGGEEQITPEFRAAYSDYDGIVTAQRAASTAAPTAAPAPTPAPLNFAPVELKRAGGNLGVIQKLLGQGTYTPTQFSTESASSITTGPGSGLYAGDMNIRTGTSAYNGINPNVSSYGGSKDAASNLSAAVQRAQYQDYLNRFAPVEDFAVGQIRGRNTADLGYDVARANQSVVNAGNNLQGQQQRAMGRYGLQYNGPSIAGSSQVAGGQVAAMNQARLADEQRTLSLIGGGAGGGNA